MMQLQQAALQALHTGIRILQGRDNQIVSEGTDLLPGLSRELEAQSERITHISLHILVVENSNQSIQRGMSVLTKRIGEVNTSVAGITTSIPNYTFQMGIPITYANNGSSNGSDRGSQYWINYIDGGI